MYYKKMLFYFIYYYFNEKLRYVEHPVGLLRSTLDSKKWLWSRKTVKTNPCCSYGGKTGEERNLAAFKDSPK